MAKKGNAIHIKLRNPDTGTFYITKKNPKSENTPGKIQLKKYDKKTRKHELFIEAKV